MLNRKRDPAVETVMPAARITINWALDDIVIQRMIFAIRHLTKKATEQHKWSDITNRGCFNSNALSPLVSHHVFTRLDVSYCRRDCRVNLVNAYFLFPK